MIRRLWIPFIALGLIVAVGCSNPAQRAAADFCKCWQPMADVIALQDTLKVQGLTDSLVAVTATAEDILEASRQCAEDKKNEYGAQATQAAFKKKARTIMEKKCPEVYARTPQY